MYNGTYDSVTEVIIKCDTHKQCLDIAQLVKKLCDAWGFVGVKYTEHKSARRGDVLCRDILIYLTGYGHEIIIFRESLKCVLSFFTFRELVSILYRNVTPTENELK